MTREILKKTFLNFVEILQKIETGEYCDNQKIEMVQLYMEQTARKLRHIFSDQMNVDLI